MSNPSSSRNIIRHIHHHIASKTSPIGNPAKTGITRLIGNNARSIPRNPPRSILHRTNFTSSSNVHGILAKLDPHVKSLHGGSFLGVRYFSSKNIETGSKEFAKKIVHEPSLAAKNVFIRYKEALRMQIEAFWSRNYLWVLGAGGIVVCILLSKVLFGIASCFVGFSEGMAKYGFLALSTAIVAFSGLYLRSRYAINESKVYIMAMTKLNTSSSILEVMGAPLTGSDLRAYVMLGGGINLRKLLFPTLNSKRCFLIFPVQGSERKGLASVQVKKTKGQYDMKLLAVDIAMGSGPEHRVFLIGDEEEYRIGGGLISELRDPVVRAMEATKEFEVRDQKEDEKDELEEAERKRTQELEN